jgi:hypothetical protein
MGFQACPLELGIGQSTHYSCEPDEPNTIPSQTFDNSAQDKDRDFQDRGTNQRGFPVEEED